MDDPFANKRRDREHFDWFNRQPAFFGHTCLGIMHVSDLSDCNEELRKFGCKITFMQSCSFRMALPPYIHHTAKCVAKVYK